MLNNSILEKNGKKTYSGKRILEKTILEKPFWFALFSHNRKRPQVISHGAHSASRGRRHIVQFGSTSNNHWCEHLFCKKRFCLWHPDHIKQSLARANHSMASCCHLSSAQKTPSIQGQKPHRAMGSNANTASRDRSHVVQYNIEMHFPKGHQKVLPLGFLALLI